MKSTEKNPNNPWKDINLSDYESHMALDSVQQLQAMNQNMLIANLLIEYIGYECFQKVVKVTNPK